MDTNTANAIESLRSFALLHNELQFAHICTTALAGEASALYDIARPLKEHSMGCTGSALTFIRIARARAIARCTSYVARQLAI